MKKITAIFLSVLMPVMIIFSGCSKQSINDRLSVVCTTFAAYDWTRQIAGENNGNIDIILLPDSNTDMHSYQASADDIIKISSCDVLIYTGGQSEAWIADAVSANKGAAVVNLMDLLGSGKRHEQYTEGMEHEHSEDEHTEEYDEHVWLSVKNAALFCEKISGVLSAADYENADLYTDNAKKYIEKLSELDVQYQDAVKAADKKTLIFGDRFPFRYLLDDYNIEYFAAFPGCSAETEASFKTVIFLANKIDELGIDCILTIDGSQSALAQTIAENTQSGSKRILSLDSMQSSGKKAVEDKKTYISIMQSNLGIIGSALG